MDAVHERHSHRCGDSSRHAAGPLWTPPPGADGRGRGAPPQRLGPTEAELKAYSRQARRSQMQGRDRVRRAPDPGGVPRSRAEQAPRRRAGDARSTSRIRTPRRTRGAAADARPAGVAAEGRRRLHGPRSPDAAAGHQHGERVRAEERGRRADQRRRPASTVRSARSTAPAYDLARNLPTVVLRNEDYGRITRLLADGTAVRLEFTIVNRDVSRRAARRTTPLPRFPAPTRPTKS